MPHRPPLRAGVERQNVRDETERPVFVDEPNEIVVVTVYVYYS